MEKRRIFVGISFNEETLRQLAQIQEQWKSILPSQNFKWLPPPNLHLTLHFLGLIDEWRVGMITNSLKKITLPDFSFLFHRVLFFPNPQHARVLCIAGQEGHSPLAHLFYRIGESLKEIGFTLETRIFIPHITLARVHPSRRCEEKLSYEALSISIESFTVYESVLSEGGSQYREVEKFPLVNGL